MSVLKKSAYFIVLSLFVIFFPAGVQTLAGSVRGDIVDVILNDTDSFFYLDVANYPSRRNALPVGVFDSGTGGLTVLDAIINFDGFDNTTHARKAGGDGVRDFNSESFVYLGDKANMAYGSYAKEGASDLLREHIIKDVQFLLGDKYYLSGSDRMFRTDKPRVKAIVIACNTATAFGKDDIERFIVRTGLDIKVIGVIDAGVRASLGFISKDEDASIAVFCTAGTVSSNGYLNTLKAQMADMDYMGDVRIFQQAGVGLAGAIDGGGEYIQPSATAARDGYKGPVVANDSMLPRYGFDRTGNALLTGDTVQLNSVGNYISYHLVTLMEKIRNAPDAKKLKVIILGCTHYPFYTEMFAARLERLYNYRENGKYIYRPYMARRIELVDPAPNVADELYRYLAKKEILNTGPVQKSGFYLSVPNVFNKSNSLDDAGEFTYEYKYGRNAGRIQEYVKRVPFSTACISEEVFGRLSKKMPLVFKMIQSQAVE